MQIAGWVIFIFVCLWVIPPTVGLLRRRLDHETPGANESAGSISVVVTACNEEPNIEATLRSLLTSRGVDLQLIAVNDRSTDATGTIIDRVAADDSRVKPVHITELPSGWLGKSHAMHVASQQATSELLLFTDGDINFDPDALFTACRCIRREQLDHLTLMPRMLPGGVIENASVIFFGLAFAIGQQVHLMRSRWRFAYAGVGAFNLIRTEFYRGFGGHQPIALDVLDDVKLGKLVRRHHGRTDFYRAPELLSVRWQDSLWGVVKGLEKNAFASIHYSIPFALLCTVIFVVAMIAPVVLPFVLPLQQSAGFLATALVWHGAFGAVASLLTGGWKLTPLFTIAVFVMAFCWWRSTYVTLKQGGIRWRGTFYSLKELRAREYR